MISLASPFQLKNMEDWEEPKLLRYIFRSLMIKYIDIFYLLRVKFIFQIKLHYPEENLICVSGYYCPVVYGGGPVIRSLTFKSNKRTFGPFGVEVGTPFNFSPNGGLIVGLYGRSGWFLDAIGFYLLSPKPSIFPRFQMRWKWFNFFAIKDGEEQKTKG